MQPEIRFKCPTSETNVFILHESGELINVSHAESLHGECIHAAHQRIFSFVPPLYDFNTCVKVLLLLQSLSSFQGLRKKAFDVIILFLFYVPVPRAVEQRRRLLYQIPIMFFVVCRNWCWSGGVSAHSSGVSFTTEIWE